MNIMTTLICSIPEKLDVRLERLAQQAKVPKAKFVRRALEHAVRKPRANGTAFNLVNNLCGSLSGPSDLATNPKYLEGLGG
jgi:predicted DNA-binding protein